MLQTYQVREYIIYIKSVQSPLLQVIFSIDILAIGPDGDIYCNICCKQINWPGQYLVPWDTSLIQVTLQTKKSSHSLRECQNCFTYFSTTYFQGEDGDRETCTRCNGKVFEAEKMITKRGLYHKENINKSKS